MSVEHFKLPDVGEGLTEADILAWRVQPGDRVEVNQILIEVETAKAAVELPSPWAGVVKELLVQEGETVDVGRPIIAIETAPSDAAVEDLVPSAATAAEGGSAIPSWWGTDLARRAGVGGAAGGRRRPRPRSMFRRPRRPSSRLHRRNPSPLSPTHNPSQHAIGWASRACGRNASWRSRRCASWPRRSASTSPG